jgi:hypothetical protein
MNRDPINSSNILSAGYDEPSQTLEVEFTSGMIYQYYNISLALFEAFMTSPSKGQFFNQNIKNAYAFSRVG